MRKLFFFILIIAICSIRSIGQTPNNKNTQQVNSGNSVNRDKAKKLNRVWPTDYVNDYENVFTEKETAGLDSLIVAIEKESTIEIGVVTIDSLFVKIWDSTYHQKLSFDSLTLHIAQRWGVGKKGKDNGILIGFSKSMRRIRIQNGFGIEKIISNDETKTILDEKILTQFKKGNYYEGVKDGILALYKKLYPTSVIH